jgi:putative acetyltransferase
VTETIIIREARVSDARALNRYMRDIYSESRHLITRPAEFRVGPWRQRLWIARKRGRRNEICLVADSGGAIVGMLESWTDGRARVRHSTTFGMSVAPTLRRRGVGKKLLSHFIEWVQKQDSLERIELHVHSDNMAAAALYDTLGFRREVTRRGAVRYEDGRIVADHIMVLWPGRQTTTHRPDEETTRGAIRV